MKEKLITDLYTKPTDTHNYLLYSSCHPQHIKKSLPYSQFLRVKRICTYEADFEKHCDMLKSHFHRRGYSDKYVEESYLKAKKQDRCTLLAPKLPKNEEEKTDKHFLITTYSPGLRTPRDIIEEHWPILGASNATSDLYNTKVVYGHRRGPNVRDLIVRARLPNKTKKQKAKHKNICTTRNCRYCSRLNKLAE